MVSLTAYLLSNGTYAVLGYLRLVWQSFDVDYQLLYATLPYDIGYKGCPLRLDIVNVLNRNPNNSDISIVIFFYSNILTTVFNTVSHSILLTQMVCCNNMLSFVLCIEMFCLNTKM